jgi:hypothetical protein
MTTGPSVIHGHGDGVHELMVGQPVMPFDYALPDM